MNPALKSLRYIVVGISYDRLESADSMDGMSEEGLDELVVQTSAFNTATAINGTASVSIAWV